MENSDPNTLENNPSATSDPEKKQPMTQEERLKLAVKLDKELDDFIAGLEKRSYTEGWPEDRWQEEMEKHPFFMTKLPEDGSPLPPLLEGMQQLKYDENINTPSELAVSYKEDGNFNFKCKKYRMAILSYTEGIRQNCGDAELEAQLYSNRAAAQFHVGNYRSSLNDSCHALRLSPNYNKARAKAAQCAVKLNLFKDAINYCDAILETNPTEPNALKIRAEAISLEKLDDRNRRKEEAENKKQKSRLEALKSAIEGRNIKYEIKGDILTSLEVAQEKPVLSNGNLTWPVFFLYPEHSTSDYIEEFNENTTFLEHLEAMFSVAPQWDIAREYQPQTLTLYFEGHDRSQLYPVNIDSTLKQVLSSGSFVVRDWKPSFLVFVKGSSSEKNFLKNYKVLI